MMGACVLFAALCSDKQLLFCCFVYYHILYLARAGLYLVSQISRGFYLARFMGVPGESGAATPATDNVHRHLDRSASGVPLPLGAE
jgi:hypothetical protein